MEVISMKETIIKEIEQSLLKHLITLKCRCLILF